MGEVRAEGEAEFREVAQGKREVSQARHRGEARVAAAAHHAERASFQREFVEACAGGEEVALRR